MSRYSTQHLQKEINNGRDKLIQTLESKVAGLKLEREILLKREELRSAQARIGRNMPEAQMQPWQLKQSIEENKKRGEQLHDLYRKKQELEHIGVHVVNRRQIDKAHEIAANVWKNDKDSQRKRQVVDQEMLRAKELLGKNRTAKEAVSEELTYEWIVNQQGGEVEGRRFRDTLKKERLSKLEQEYLLEAVFKYLQNERQLVSKEVLQRTLACNPKFCEHFHITKRQIKHDIGVCDCKDPEGLSYREYYELIKSIQLTSQAKKKPKPTPPAPAASQAPKKATKAMSAEATDKLIRNYLKNLFERVDKDQQFIVPRSSIATAVEKASYLTKEEQAKISTGFLKDFGRHLKVVAVTDKDHYKKLSKEYVSYNEVVREYEWFAQHYNTPPQQPKKPMPQEPVHQQQQQALQHRQEQESELNGMEEPSQQLFEEKHEAPLFEAGRQESQEYEVVSKEPPQISQQEAKEQLETFDGHYRQLSEQYREEITRDDLEREEMRKQLRNLENYISYLQSTRRRH